MDKGEGALREHLFDHDVESTGRSVNHSDRCWCLSLSSPIEPAQKCSYCKVSCVPNTFACAECTKKYLLLDESFVDNMPAITVTDGAPPNASPPSWASRIGDEVLIRGTVKRIEANGAPVIVIADRREEMGNWTFQPRDVQASSEVREAEQKVIAKMRLYLRAAVDDEISYATEQEFQEQLLIAVGELDALLAPSRQGAGGK